MNGQEQSDEAFARQLQAEEEAAAHGYEQHQREHQYYQNQHSNNDDRMNSHPSYNPLSQASSREAGTAHREPEPSIEAVYPVLEQRNTYDDEIIAQNLQQEMKDEEIARALQAREEARVNAPLRNNSTSTRVATAQVTPPPPRRCGKKSICYGGIMAVIVGSAAVIIIFFGDSIWSRIKQGSNDDRPPYFESDWGKGDGSATGSFSQWKNKNKGLTLKIRNSLSSDWDEYFVQAVSDWNAAPALDLSTEDSAEDPDCVRVRGIMKVCNAAYGKLGWTGLNEVYYEGSFIAASVAKMNESYLGERGTSTAEKQYVMCHEIGHGFGLPHRDEIPNNPDLLSCLDYTYRFDKNKMPDVLVDFDNLTNLYGVIESRNLRMLRNSRVDEKYLVQTAETVPERKEWHYSEGRILHKSDRREIYENDLGGGMRVVTTLLLAK